MNTTDTATETAAPTVVSSILGVAARNGAPVFTIGPVAKAARAKAVADAVNAGKSGRVTYTAVEYGQTFVKTSATMVYRYAILVQDDRDQPWGAVAWTGQDFTAACNQAEAVRQNRVSHGRPAKVKVAEVKAYAATSDEAKAARLAAGRAS